MSTKPVDSGTGWPGCGYTMRFQGRLDCAVTFGFELLGGLQRTLGDVQLGELNACLFLKKTTGWGGRQCYVAARGRSCTCEFVVRWACMLHICLSLYESMRFSVRSSRRTLPMFWNFLLR
jgi:hypothetical protein